MLGIRKVLKSKHQCRFQLLNHRADMQFVLVANLTSWLGGFDVLARSPIIKPKNYNEPLQGHLARTANQRCELLSLLAREVLAQH